MSNPYEYPAQQPPAAVKPKWSTGKKVGVGVGSFLAFCVVLSAVDGDKSSTAAASSSTLPTLGSSSSSPAPTTPAGPRTSFGAGTFLVGTQIEAGTYQAAGGSNCYYERRSNTSSDFGGIIANEWSPDSSQQIVTIDPSDVAFKSSGCGMWRKIG